MNRYKKYCNVVNFWLDQLESIENTQQIISIKLNDDETIMIDVKKCSLTEKRCSICKNLYHSIIVEGTLYENNQTFKFSGFIGSSYAMCECGVDDPEEWWNDTTDVQLLTNFIIERSSENIYRYFIDEKTPIKYCYSILDDFDERAANFEQEI